MNNTYEQLKANDGNGVAIMQSTGGSREKYFDGWLVYRMVDGKPVDTDPTAAWYHYNLKWFGIGHYKDKCTAKTAIGRHHEIKRMALEAAQRFVKDMGWYDGPWARNKLGDYVPVAINKKFRIF